MSTTSPTPIAEPPPPRLPAATADADGEVVDPADLVAALGRHRRRLVLWPLVAGLLAAVASLVLPPTFTATTTLLPPQQASSGAAAMLSQLGGLGGAAGGALGIKNPSDLYVAMLRSTTVADALLEKHGLQARWGETYRVDARKRLADATRITADKSGVIAVEVDAREPALAADLANGYVAELHRLTSTLAVTDAAQRRVFFERQLELTKQKLAEAEGTLRSALDQGGLVSVDALGRASLETGARLRGQISAKEVQIAAMAAYATDDHPDMRRATQELTALRQELGLVETGGRAPVRGAAPAASAGSGLENLRVAREVKFQETMLEQLTRQFELARVEESREAPLVQVLDRASPPEKRSKPKRTLLTLGAAGAALFLAVLAAFAQEALAGARRDPARREKLAAVRSAWLGRP